MSVYGMDEGRNLHPVYTKEEIATILQQLINGGTLAGIDPNLTPIIKALREANGKDLSFWLGTEAEYNAINPAPAAKEIMLRVGADGKVYFCTDNSMVSDLMDNLISAAENTVADGVAAYQGAIQTNAANITKVSNDLTAAETRLAAADTSINAAKQDKHKTATATLTVAGWSSNAQTVTVSGVTASNTVFVSADAASMSAYGAAGVKCTAQAAGKLTFTCDSVPEAALTVNVTILGV